MLVPFISLGYSQTLQEVRALRAPSEPYNFDNCQWAYRQFVWVYIYR